MKKITKYFLLLLVLFTLVNINEEVVAENSKEIVFKDIREDYWAYHAILFGAENQLIHGFEDGEFKPQKEITEGEFAIILSNYLTTISGLATNTENSKELELNHRSDEAYKTLANLEVPLMGYNDLFVRTTPVSRGLFSQAISYLFNDVHDLEQSVEFMFDNEITYGFELELKDNFKKYGVNNNLTRAQVMVFFYRMYNKSIVDLGSEAKQINNISLSQKVNNAINRVDKRSVENYESDLSFKMMQLLQKNKLESLGYNVNVSQNHFIVLTNDHDPWFHIINNDDDISFFISKGSASNSLIYETFSAFSGLKITTLKEGIQTLKNNETDHFFSENVYFEKSEMMYSITIDTQRLSREKIIENGTYKIPILTYHHFDTDKDKLTGIIMHPDTFEAQMKLLKEEGFTTLTSEDVLKIYEKKMEMPAKPVMITIDDGYESNYTYAFPVLKKLNMKATIFVMTDHIVNPQNHPSPYPKLSWEQMQEMAWTGLISIQSHTHNQHHRYKPFNNKGQIIAPMMVNGKMETQEEYEKRIYDDLVASKAVLEEHLLMPVHALAYPFGDFSNTSEEVTKKAGYKMTLSIVLGSNNILKDPEPFLLKRVNVNGKGSYGKPENVLKNIEYVLGMK